MSKGQIGQSRLTRIAGLGLWIVVAVLLALAAPAWASTYYVSTSGSDSNDGSSAYPWRTIQWATDHISNGDTIIVRAGTYTGARIDNSGTASQPKTLKADTGATVILNVQGARCTHTGVLEVELTGGTVSYWVVDGLTVDGVSQSQRCIDVRQTDHVTVQNCTTHHSSYCGVYMSWSFYALNQYNTSYSNVQMGTYCNNSADYGTIRFNNFYSNGYCGIHTNGDLSQGGDGIMNYWTIEKNRCYSNGSTGINSDGVSDSKFINNLIYNNLGSGMALFATNGAEGSSRNLVYNNTVDMPSGSKYCINMPLSDGVPNPTANKIKNNILYNPNTNSGCIKLWGPSPSGFESDYNAVCDRFSVDNDDSLINFATWKTYGYDAHSFLSTPSALFVTPGSDYHLKAGSPAIDAGTTLAEVTTDIEGNSRPQGGAYDIGCYEKQQASSLNITTTSLPDGQIGVAYSQTLAATGGTTPYTWSLNAGSLPAGLSLSSGGVISGAPTTAGTANFTVKVTDAVSATDTQALSIGIPADLVVTTSSLSDGQTGTAYSQTLAASGGKTPYSWAVASGSLPAGLSLSSAGVISGTPTAAGTSNFTARVTDSQTPADTATKALSIAIYADLTVTTANLPNGQIGVAYSQTLAASGGKTPYTWSLQSGSLPAGLSLSSGGVISGTPTTSGTSNFTVRVVDSESPADTATKALSIYIIADLVITTTSLADGQVGTAYSQTLAATGGVTPFTWSVLSGSLPVGLSLGSSTGTISGTPTAAGTSNFTVQVTDSQSPADTATKALTINIYVDLTVTTPSLPNGQIGVAYSQTLAASGGKTPYTWSLASGSLPAGLSLSSGGVISGTPTTGGTSNFTARATDSESPADTATKPLSIEIPADLVVTTASLPNGVVGTAYSQTLAATGGVTPYSWSLASGSLPAGLSLSSGGVISGTPNTAGTSNFTVRVTDSQTPADTATKALSIVVTSGGTSATYQFAGNDTEVSTTSTSFVNRTTLTFTPSASDDWVVFAFAEIKNSSTSYMTKVQLTIDGAVAQDGSVAPKTTSDYQSFAGAKVLTLSAASHTMNIDYATSNASGAAYIRNARIAAIRKASLVTAGADQGDTPANLTTTMTNYATATWTPATTGDYLLITSASFNGATTSYSTTLNAAFNAMVLDDCTVTASNTGNWYSFIFFKTASCDAGVQQNLSMAAAKQSGSAATHQIKRARAIAIRLTGSRFSGFQYLRAASEQTTTSTSWVQAGTKSWSVGTAANWLLLTSWRDTNTSTSYSVEAQEQLDNSITMAAPLQRPQKTGDYLNAACIDVRNLATGTRVLDVDYRTKNSAGTAKIKYIFFVGLPLE